MIRQGVSLFGKALRETGQALDRVGLRIAEKELFNETFARHRQLMTIFNKTPSVSLDAFVAPNATLVGDVTVSSQASIWYGAVLRGDNHPITVGHHTNIQDKVVINNTQELQSDTPPEVNIGHHVTIGHGAILTSCVLQDHVVIGMSAVISNGCFVGRNSMIAAGSVLLANTIVPSGQLWAGNPAVYIRDVREEEIHSFDRMAVGYADLGEFHANEFLPFGTTYQEAERVGVYKK